MASSRWRIWVRTWKTYRQNKPKPQPSLNYDAYGRNANLYFNGPEYREFKALTKELARALGTRNQSDTVLAALRRLNWNHQVLRLASSAKFHRPVLEATPNPRRIPTPSLQN